MLKKIRQFLERSGGKASGIAIVRNVLFLRNASPAFADRVLSEALTGLADIRPDGLGNWVLLPQQKQNISHADEIVYLIETPMRPAEIRASSRVVLGFTRLSADESNESGVYSIALTAGVNGADDEFESLSAGAFVAKFESLFQNSVIVSWTLSRVNLALQRIAAAGGQFYVPGTTIALPALARHLLKLQRHPSFEETRRLLLNEAVSEEKLAGQLNAGAEMVKVMRLQCGSRGLDSWEQIGELARRSFAADFTTFEFDQDFISRLPQQPGVYLMRNQNGKVIYVGKADDLKRRVQSYFASEITSDEKVRKLRSRLSNLSYKTVDTALDALLLEQKLIRRHRPELNKQQRIHHRRHTQHEKLTGIYLLPATRVTAKTPMMFAYVLSSAGLKKFKLRAGRVPSRKFCVAVAGLFETAPTASIAFATYELEIAASWLHQNRLQVSSLLPDQLISPEEMIAAATSLVNSFDPQLGPQRFAAAGKDAVAAHTSPEPGPRAG